MKLLRKGVVISANTGIILQIAPLVNLATVLVACAMLPIGGCNPIISFEGDFILFSALLLSGKFLLLIGAMENGSSFEGMGVAREALYSMLAEPVFVLLFAVLSMVTGQMSFVGIFAGLTHLTPNVATFTTIGAVIVLLLALIENSRLPLDDPKTHLELTMIHEVIVLDYSGFDLGLIHLASSIRIALFGAVIAGFFIPVQIGIVPILILFLGIQLLYAMMIGAVESFMARFRMNHNPQFILALTSIGFLLFFAASLVTGKFAIL
jgi:formate hydrogenlyase subunit 4